MVKVNLLPPKERTKKQVIKENITAIFLSILAFAIIIGFTVLLFFIHNNIIAEEKNIEKEINSQKNKNNKYGKIEEIIKDLNTNLERIKKIQKLNPKYTIVLNDLKSKIPSELSLTEISTINTVIAKTAPKTSENENSEKNTNTATKNTSTQLNYLIIKGMSSNQYSIVRFKESLTKSSLLQIVDFESSTFNSEKNKYEFQLKAKIKQ